ncbi:MAG: mercury methylation corrinoid protein HgcA [Eubacteriales bacterium]
MAEKSPGFKVAGTLREKKVKDSCCGSGENTCGCKSEEAEITVEEQSCCNKKESSCDCGKDKSIQKEESCCGGRSTEKWVTGSIETPAGKIPRVSTKLDFSDICGSWKARWNINRMDYTVNPGLYCVGNANPESPVLVTSNYKMTFDRLRQELGGLDAWILVLDTKGINVWCAAGKGTFGTDELVRRIESSKLKYVVSHKKLILPQLGATGVSGYKVARQTGFHVQFGPVRAKDIKAYLAAGMKATVEMRRVQFTTVDRMILTPIEIVAALKPAAIFLGILFILNAIGFGHYGLVDLYAFSGAILAGAFVTPVLLPWIPGRAFAFKGFLIGLIWAVGVGFLNGWPGALSIGWIKEVAYLAVLPALSAFIAMNFTGASTYTSPTGVVKEMKAALPLQMIGAGAGIVLLIVNDIVLLLK